MRTLTSAPRWPRNGQTDLETVQEVLKEYPFFSAGIIEREPFSISPILFTKEKSQSMEVSCDPYEKPERARSVIR
jgi:hypothetical protein